MSWGYHLILDCSDCNLERMRDKENITAWIKDLVKQIDMEPVGEPIIERVAEDQVDKAGYTVLQTIVTSHITAHFVDSAKQIYLDVFSCRKFDRTVVRESIIKHFWTTNFREYFLTRQAG